MTEEESMFTVAHSAFTLQVSQETLQVAVEMIFMATAQELPQQFTPTVLLLATAALQ